MQPVIYSMSVSLDGFIAGPQGDTATVSCPLAARLSRRI
jgi:hypothetical protein